MRFILVAIVLVFLFFLRVYLLSQVGLYDYDSVKNYQILNEISEGNWSNLFYHRSPFFFIFFSFFYQINSAYLFLEYTSAALNLTTIWLVLGFCHYPHRQKYNPYSGSLSPSSLTNPRKQLINKGWDLPLLAFSPTSISALLLLFAGTSLFMVNSSRYLSIENLSGLLFMMLLLFYQRSIQEKKIKLLYLSAFLFGLFYTSNSKAILFLPIFLLLEIFQKQRKLSLRNILFAFLLAAFPVCLCILIGTLAGIPAWKYPAIIYVGFFSSKSENVSALFNTDVLYYLKYIWYFENPLLLPGLFLFFVFALKNLLKKSGKGEISFVIFFISIAHLSGMSLLLKAPRGLSFIYPLLYLLAFWGLLELFSKLHPTAKSVFYLLIGGSIIFQTYRIQANIYAFSETNYDKVAHYLEKNKINKIATTVGINLIPFLDTNKVQWRGVFNEKEFKELQKQGFWYILLDDYSVLTNLQNFKNIEKLKTVAQWEEATLKAPLLFLEHSEFTALSFEESLKLRKKVVNKPYQLRLVKVKVADF